MRFTFICFFITLIILLNFVSVPAIAEPSPATESTVVEPILIDLSNMKLVGEMTTTGVRASAYIVKITPEENLAASHRVIVTFVNEESAVPLTKGLIGIKHRKLFGDISKPVWMRSTSDQPELFISEISLNKPGTYLFIVGSKLEDDKKRQFTFQYRR